jgi:DNA ligase-1
MEFSSRHQYIQYELEDDLLILFLDNCSECPNYDTLVKAFLEVGINGLQERCKLTPGIPPRPMLAQPTKGAADILQRFEGIKFTCEYKYDGERAQVCALL